MASPKSFGTLSEFLLQAGTEYFVIDVSRTRGIIDSQTFFNYETNKTPFASPRQGNAWLCVVFWNKQVNKEHYIWFIKLPIDEQSLLQQAARDQFLNIVTDALGQQLQNMGSTQAQIPDNPFIFTPSQQLLADCNALIRHQLGFPARDAVKTALAYLKAPDVQPWSELSVQDISDLAITIHNQSVQDAFVQNLEILPNPVCTCICSSFEGITLPISVQRSLIDYHQRCESNIAPMLLRALASCRSETVNKYIESVIRNNDALDTETLVVIAGRHWQVLSPELSTTGDLLAIYFEKLALADTSHALFRGVYADMVHLPALRVFLLAMIRDPGLSDTLKSAVSTLFEKEQKA